MGKEAKCGYWISQEKKLLFEFKHCKRMQRRMTQARNKAKRTLKSAEHAHHLASKKEKVVKSKLGRKGKKKQSRRQSGAVKTLLTQRKAAHKAKVIFDAKDKAENRFARKCSVVKGKANAAKEKSTKAGERCKKLQQKEEKARRKEREAKLGLQRKAQQEKINKKLEKRRKNAVRRRKEKAAKAAHKAEVAA